MDSDKKINIAFWISFGLAIALIVTLLIIYFFRFNGDWSEDISDWANFSSFVYGFSTVILTAINVWLFYRLTSSANAINKQGRTTSDGIINAYTQEEDKRSRANVGVALLREYKTAHADLMQLLSASSHGDVNYRAIRVASCNLESVYMILHTSSKIFPSLSNYPKHDAYIEELHGIANNTDENLFNIEEGNNGQIIFRNIPGLQDHHDTVIDYFEDIMSCIQSDLGSIYTNRQNPNNNIFN